MTPSRRSSAALATYPETNPRPVPSPRRLELATSHRRQTSLLDQVPCRELSGNTVAERQAPGFQVIEKQYSPGVDLGRHVHNQAHLVYVHEGPYVESYGDASQVICAPRTLRYLPPNYPHANVFESGARCLIVNIEPETLERVRKHTTSLERPAAIQTPQSMWLTQKLCREFQQRDASSAIALEGILLELLAEAARHAGSGPVRVIPEWLRVAREYVEANYLQPLSLADIARVAHVHRVHLARQFRTYFSSSVGELLRRRRVEHACHLVSTTNITLAEIAIDCCFSDQSHFSATFRRLMGSTPARFREMTQDRSVAAPHL